MSAFFGQKCLCACLFYLRRDWRWFGFITVALLVAACSSPPSPYPGRLNPITGQWTAYGTGTGITAQLPNPFAIPTQASGKTINYVYTAPLGLVQGRIITINYSVTGDAMFAPLPEAACGADGCGPSELRLFIWGNNADTAQDRWWCPNAKPLILGNNQSISCIINQAWTGTGLASPQPEQFSAAVSNPFAVGITFGGMFAGHGDWAITGSANLTINSFSVQ